MYKYSCEPIMFLQISSFLPQAHFEAQKTTPDCIVSLQRCNSHPHSVGQFFSLRFGYRYPAQLSYRFVAMALSGPKYTLLSSWSVLKPLEPQR